MPDDSIIPSGDRIADDELHQLNGVPTVPDNAGRLPKAQRFKTGFGVDGSLTDVSDDDGKRLPVSDPAVAAAIAALAAALGTPLEPGDLATLATAARQDASKASLDAIAALLTSHSGYLDGLEGLLGRLPTNGAASEATLAAVVAAVDGVEALLARLPAGGAATEASLAAVVAAVDGVEGLLGRLPVGGAATEASLAAAKVDLDTISGAVGGPGSGPPALVNNGSGLLGYLRNLLDAGRSMLAALSDGSMRVGGTVATSPSSAGDVAATLTSGRKTVAAAGTPVALRAAIACKWVTVTALTSNTGQVNVGGAGVLATTGGSTGIPLTAGQSATIPVADAASVFVDARVNGEGVSFLVGA